MWTKEASPQQQMDDGSHVDLARCGPGNRMKRANSLMLLDAVDTRQIGSTVASRWRGMTNRAAARPLNRHRMRRLLSPFEENVASRAHAAEMRPVLPEDGALVANRFDSILGRSRL